MVLVSVICIWVFLNLLCKKVCISLCRWCVGGLFVFCSSWCIIVVVCCYLLVCRWNRMVVLLGKYWYIDFIFMFVCLVMCVVVKCGVFLCSKIWIVVFRMVVISLVECVCCGVLWREILGWWGLFMGRMRKKWGCKWNVIRKFDEFVIYCYLMEYDGFVVFYCVVFLLLMGFL